MPDSTATIEVKYASQANWYTGYGVYLKQQILAREGFPMCDNWMMITLTIDQSQFDSPEQAFDYLLDTKKAGKKNKVAAYMKKVANYLFEWGYFKDAEHCVNWRKLEFQSNGWAHWHIFTNLTRRITKAQLQILCDLWPFGRVRYDKLDCNAHYAFKYAFKCPFKKVVFDPEGNMTIEEVKMQRMLPEWFAEKYEIVDGKPFTYDRARFFQRSRNFMKNHQAWLRATGQKWKNYKVIRPVKPAQEKKSSIRPVRVKERLATHLSKVQFTARREDGTYVKSSTVTLTKPFHVFTQEVLIPKLLDGSAVSVKPHHYIITDISDANLTPLAKHKYKTLCQKNKLTLSKAIQTQRFQQALNHTGLPLRAKLYRSRNGKTGETRNKSLSRS